MTGDRWEVVATLGTFAGPDEVREYMAVALADVGWLWTVSLRVELAPGERTPWLRGERSVVCLATALVETLTEQRPLDMGEQIMNTVHAWLSKQPVEVQAIGVGKVAA